VALKGSNGNEELAQAENAIKTLGGKVELKQEYTLPNGDGRTLIVIKKVAQTPEKFPRNKGMIKKKKL
ncbi:MAG: 16S rRNA (guanine(527)-N(7))-methyltransferase RsmG, partial [Ruminococcus sp.]|nr:16S rRNA (guanine(527)-N(7))-methyltransferase RsmG [Ruminococcus sp.]